MYLCMYVRTYVCMYIYIYIYTHTYTSYCSIIVYSFETCYAPASLSSCRPGASKLPLVRGSLTEGRFKSIQMGLPSSYCARNTS